MFGAIFKINNSIRELGIKDLFFRLFLDKEFTDFIIELNTRKQLFDKGIASDDMPLSQTDRFPAGSRWQSQGGVYSVATENGIDGQFLGKIKLGLPIDRITLFQTGEFYRTFKCKWLFSEKDGAIQITADTIKDGEDLIDRFGSEILGLNEDSLQQLRAMARKKIPSILVNELKKAA